MCLKKCPLTEEGETGEGIGARLDALIAALDALAQVTEELLESLGQSSGGTEN